MNLTNIRVRTVAALLLAAVGLVACKGSKNSQQGSDETPPPVSKPLADNSLQTFPGKKIDGASEFICRIDSLSFAAKIKTTDTLKVRVYGYVGSNGCYGFRGFDRKMTTAMSLKISALGYFFANPNAQCTMALVFLDETYTILPPHLPGTYNLEFPQPDGKKSFYANIEVK